MRIEAAEGLRWLNDHPDVLVTVDTETTGLRVDDGRDVAIGASVAYRDGEGELQSFYIGWGHAVGRNADPILREQFAWILEEQRRTISYHNAQFDMNALWSVGIDVLDNPFYDTPTMANLINENTPYTKELGALCQHYIGDAVKLSEWQWEKEFKLKVEKTTGWPNTTPAMMDKYARLDAEGAHLLLEHFLEHRFWLELPESIWIEKQETIRVLTTMKRRGVRLNQELTRELLEEGEAEKLRIQAELGLNPASHNDAEELFINRLRLPILKRSTKTHKPSFDKSVMAEYDLILDGRGDATAKTIKAYRGWNTAVGLLLRPYLAFVSPDGRLRTTYTTHVTHTGRLSARDPNLQQISKKGEQPWNNRIKSCFDAEDDYDLWNFDFSQLELRLATAYSGEWLKEVFADPTRDVFTEMTVQLVEQLSAALLVDLAKTWTRHGTKTLTYSMQYGAGVTRIKNAFGVSEKVAREIIENYRRTFPRFRRLNESITAMAERDLRAPLWSGRFRKFRYRSEGYKAMNSVIQGGAADIVERVMVRCFRAFDSDECRLLLTVHDSLVWEIKKGREDYYVPRIKAMMEDVDAVTLPMGDRFDVVFPPEAEKW
jgi:DNA polymerase I-like protein with 3'-5' exonuclease and polymerase domains